MPKQSHEDATFPSLAATTDEAWKAAATEYIECLRDALAQTEGPLYAHGRKEDDAVVQRGKELQAILGIQETAGKRVSDTRGRRKRMSPYDYVRNGFRVADSANCEKLARLW